MDANLVQDGDNALIDGAYQAAIDIYDKVGEDNAHVIGHRGCAYWALGRRQEAFNAFRRAAELEPDNLRWRYRVAMHELENGRAESMRKIADECGHPCWIRDMARNALKAPPIKYDWYQTDRLIVITLHCRNASECQPSIEEGTKLFCHLAVAEGEKPVFSLELAKAVKNPVVKLFPLKVEVHLEKVNAGEPWPELVKAAESKTTAAKSKPKNWDAILQEMNEDPKDEELGVDDFFKNIYASGSEEVRKAMIKSFQESGGTVLSTNWNEVSKGKVDVQPPDGMEFRKWD